MKPQPITVLLTVIAACLATVSASAFFGGTLTARSGVTAIADKAPERTEVATFAAGCFWCTESDFDKVKGVVETISGFIGGKTKNPTYKQVTYGDTGHHEAVQVTYDPTVVSYKELLEVYWRNVDFTDGTGQFCDRGSSYEPAIFVHTPEQKAAAEDSLREIQSMFKQKVVVPIEKATEFTPAEDYHQNFYKKNPFHYYRYRIGCGRDGRLEDLWSSKKGS